MNRVILYAVAVCCAWFLVSSCASVSKRYGDYRTKPEYSKETVNPQRISYSADGQAEQVPEGKMRYRMGTSIVLPISGDDERLSKTPQNILGYGYSFNNKKIAKGDNLFNLRFNDTVISSSGVKIDVSLTDKLQELKTDLELSAHLLSWGIEGSFSDNSSNRITKYSYKERNSVVGIKRENLPSFINYNPKEQLIATEVHFGHKYDLIVQGDENTITQGFSAKYLTNKVKGSRRKRNNTVSAMVKGFGYSQKKFPKISDSLKVHELYNLIGDSFQPAEPTAIDITYSVVQNIDIDSIHYNPEPTFVFEQGDEYELVGIEIRVNSKNADGDDWENFPEKEGVDIVGDIFMPDDEIVAISPTIDNANNRAFIIPTQRRFILKEDATIRVRMEDHDGGPVRNDYIGTAVMRLGELIGKEWQNGNAKISYDIKSGSKKTGVVVFRFCIPELSQELKDELLKNKE